MQVANRDRATPRATWLRHHVGCILSCLPVSFAVARRAFMQFLGPGSLQL